jgi:glycerol-3-phosphate responsive antiterminator
MKEWISKYQKAIVGTGAVAVLVLCYFQQKELSKLRKEQKIEIVAGGDIQKEELIDSLQSELFVAQTISARYEIALELLKEENPKAAEAYELILTTKTE